MARKKTSTSSKPPRKKAAAARRSPTVKVVVLKKAPKKKIHYANSIIDCNRKTEICRNWEKGSCIFGARCAFAHGADDIKHKTLRQLEKEGRIPDASKHHSYLCMTWVSTGACPYGIGCLLIHDARATGPVEATLRPPPSLERVGGSSSSRSGSSKLLCGEAGDRGSPLFFPEIPRDLDSIELPADKVRYELDPSDAPYTGGPNLSAVCKLWYSFLSTMIEQNVLTINGTPTTTAGSANAAPNSTGPRPDPPAKTKTKTTRASYKDAATRSLSARHSAAKAADAAAPAARALLRRATRAAMTSRAPSTAAGATGATGATAAATSAAASRPATYATAVAAPRTKATKAPATAAATPPPAAPWRLGRLKGVLEMDIPQPKDSVKHLPVFESLCKGQTLARPDSLPLPDTPVALEQGGGAAGGGEDDVPPSPVPSSFSMYYSPTSSPSPTVAAAPPSPAGGTAAVGVVAPGDVQLEGDSYSSCLSSPVWSTEEVKPPPGFEGVRPSTASGGWSSASTDAASWTSSGSSSEHDDEDDHIGGKDDGGFDFLQDFGEPLPASWTPTAVAGEDRVPRTTARLPFFSGLYSDGTGTGTSNSSNGPSTSIAANGGEGMFYLLLPGGGGGTAGGGGGASGYVSTFDSGGSRASGYGNGGGFVDAAATTAVRSYKPAYGYPMAQAEYHRQQSYAGAAGHNTRNIYATQFF